MTPNLNLNQFTESGKKQMDDMLAMGKQSTEAFIESGSIMAKGTEAVVKVCMESAQAAGEKNAEIFQSLVGCKSVTEFAEAQNRITQGFFEDMMAASTKVSEMSVKMMMDAFEPLNKQMTEAMTKSNKAFAG